jgi:hypothetical protein
MFTLFGYDHPSHLKIKVGIDVESKIILFSKLGNLTNHFKFFVILLHNQLNLNWIQRQTNFAFKKCTQYV